MGQTGCRRGHHRRNADWLYHAKKDISIGRTGKLMVQSTPPIPTWHGAEIEIGCDEKRKSDKAWTKSSTLKRFTVTRLSQAVMQSVINIRSAHKHKGTTCLIRSPRCHNVYRSRQSIIIAALEHHAAPGQALNKRSMSVNFPRTSASLEVPHAYSAIICRRQKVIS